jgi:hypothetical protein
MERGKAARPSAKGAGRKPRQMLGAKDWQGRAIEKQ